MQKYDSYLNSSLTGIQLDDKVDLQKLPKSKMCCLNIVDPMDINVKEMHDLTDIDMVNENRSL